MGGNVEWLGLILIIDPVACVTTGPANNQHWSATVAGGTEIFGGFFIFNTSGTGNAPSDVCIDTQGGGNGGVVYDSEKIRNAGRGLPFFAITYREY